MLLRFSFFFVATSVLLGCSQPEKNYRFVRIDAAESGIGFANTITENEEINVANFQYCYNGGGVGIGDFDQNGLPDIVFTGNQVSSRLYLNQGDMSFDDITEKAGFETDSWVTGVSIVDIDSDGRDDIYLNVGGAACNNDCPNLLYVNQGNGNDGVPTFREQAKEYGLADGNYAQQTVFFDYDTDGDLDAFILHNGNTGFDKNNPIPKRYMEQHLKDRLLRNETRSGLVHPIFTDVSDSLGIVHGGFGLGLGISDFNGDHLPDIYVANDFITEDLLYIQKRGGDSLSIRYEEMGKRYLGHETFNAMGVDIADINNDTLPDILTVDMLPENYERQKKMLGSMNYEKYLLSQRNGYNSQYVRNTLQLHNGFLNDSIIPASEVALMKGIAKTDWSWAPLMVDFDNDGDRDIYISNGYVKDVTDLDYINYSSQNNVYGSTEYRQKKQMEFVDRLDSIYLPNYIYENDENINFTDVSDLWTDAVPSFSNGMAYADFDLDGDLDLAVNNINEKAFLLENRTLENVPKDDSKEVSNHYLRIRLKGSRTNPRGIGAKIKVWNKGKVQQQYQSVIRGYLSSVEPIVHFGTLATDMDSVQVRWPNGKISKLGKVKTDQVLTFDISEAVESPGEKSKRDYLFVQNSKLIDFEHTENYFVEYHKQSLLTRQSSQMGPCIATGNIDGRRGDEIFIGGSKGFAGQLWVQDSDGSYIPEQVLDADYEDTDALFVDIDGDADLDLYVSSGSTDFDGESEFYQDRIYLNDGSGQLTRAEGLLPDISESSHCVRPSDIDRDGDIDFFIGARNVPGKYPNIPESTILINDDGRFTAKSNSGIANIGMVSDAVWRDIDDDGWDDLIAVGEWMPITVFKNDKGALRAMPLEWTGANEEPIRTEGWWNSVASADFDGDGDFDMVLGNQGLNSFVQPNQDRAVYLYKGDFDQNGSPDPILAQYFETEQGFELLPVHTRDDIVSQLVSLKKRYLTYEAFTKVNFEQLLGIQDLEVETLSAYEFASSYAENLGNGKFKLTPLPTEAQIAPINDMLVGDYNSDGRMDVLTVGNDFSAETLYGRFDASTGLLLLNKKKGFETMPSKGSGFYVPGQSHHLCYLTDQQGNRFVLATQNQAPVKAFGVESGDSLALH